LFERRETNFLNVVPFDDLDGIEFSLFCRKRASLTLTKMRVVSKMKMGREEKKK